MTEDRRWHAVAELFDRLLDAEDPEAVLCSEPAGLIRDAAAQLWRHHVRAEEEDYLGAPISFEPAPIFGIGQRLIGRFRIDRMLGSGGMGEVYLAWDERMEDYVAIKTIARLLSPSDAIQRRFTAEVQNARRVTHPNVCRIHELFADAEAVFFSMEYLEGTILSELAGTPMVAAHGRAILRQLADGLFAAHRIGVVHGDFKPANVMVVPAASGGPPRAVIMDFGLARAVDQSVVAVDHRLSLRAGTAEYMAPEIAAGEAPNIRSDIFAFGRVARLLMPGERVWEDCTRADPQERPESLEKVVRRLSQTSRRYWLAGIAAASVAGARYLAAPPVRGLVSIPADARILVNGFQAASAPAQGAQLVRSLLLTGLRQSSRIRAIDDQDLLPALQRLRPGSSLPLAGSALFQLLAQLRAGYWIDGSLRKTGGRYLLDLRLLATAGQQVVAASMFPDAPSLISLAQNAALWVRRTAGESSRSMEANPSDVGRFTSEIPEALQSYYRGMEHYATADMEQAVFLFQEAIRLDPQFAQAHCMLGLSLDACDRYEEGFQELEAAMEGAGRLPDRERVFIEMHYYPSVEDPVQMVASARQNLAFSPDEPRSYISLAQRLVDAGQTDEGIGLFQKACSLAPEDWMPSLMLQYAFLIAGQFDQALAEFQSALARGISNPWIYDGAGCAYLALERYGEANDSFVRKLPDYESAFDIQSVRIMEGRLEIAIAGMKEHRAGAHNPIQAHWANEFLCSLYFDMGRREEARVHLREMSGLPAYPSMSRRLSCTASWARRLGEDTVLALVRGRTDEIASRWPNAFNKAMALHTHALQSWVRNSLDEAEQGLLEASGGAVELWTLFDLADFLTSRGKWDVAAEHWRNFESQSGTVFVKKWYPGVLIAAWLGRAASALGMHDLRTSFQYSQKVLSHWGHANPQLQMVQAARNINLMSNPW
jgi:serine/threonine protein kinase